MIKIVDKTYCCGCGACEQICAKKAIQLIPDNEGFGYPEVNEELCVDCGLCIKSCPVINQNDEREPLDVYAAVNKDESIRGKSSSGGIFSIVAEEVLEKGGVVFGVRFNENWEVIFDYFESIDKIDDFRRSKYVQAKVGDSYKDVLRFLKQGKYVLFTGTPCQIAGLRLFLRKEYENLILMDVICEGVPSPKLWKMYLEEEFSKQCKQATASYPNISTKELVIKDISFRNKESGWNRFSFSLNLTKRRNGDGDSPILYSYVNRDSAYMQAMFNYLDLRPICYVCPFKKCKSYSDITIADYWGIDKLHPEFNDNRGASMIFIHTEKGKSILSLEKMSYIKTNYKESFKFNNIITSSKKHPRREAFYKRIDTCESIISLLEYYTPTPTDIVKAWVKKLMNFLLPSSLCNYLLSKWRGQ